MEFITGVTREDAVDRPLLEVFPRLEETGDHASLQEALAGETTIAKESIYALGDWDRPVFFEIHFSPLRNEAEARVVGVAFFRNITERKLAEQALKDLSVRDPLTNLYNRRYFNKRIEEEISRATRQESRFALSLCDLDDFNKVNDTRSHQFGDEILTAAGQGIQDATRDIDFVFRWGGNEFVVILLVDDRQGIIDAGERIRKRIVELKEICFRKQIEAAEAHGLDRVFINVDFKLLEHLGRRGKLAGLEVILEISEKEALIDIEHHLAVAQEWRAEGFKFAFDDFGVGFISLPFLADLEPEYIKRDRLTILQAVASDEFRAFLNHVVLGLRQYARQGIVAEGIESDEELAIAQEIGIHLVQGYLFGEPGPINHSKRGSVELPISPETGRMLPPPSYPPLTKPDRPSSKRSDGYEIQQSANLGMRRTSLDRSGRS